MDPDEGLELPFKCERARLCPELAGAFLELAPDQELSQFMRASAAERPGPLRYRAYLLLRRFMSDYAAYGVLGMYRMHLLSAAQWRALLPGELLGGQARLLDVGAGRGDASAALWSAVAQVHATEPARPLARALSRRGARVYSVDFCRESWPGEQRFEIITCLNVLDRVSHPWTMLSHLRACLSPAGVLVVAVPLPIRPCVYRGGRSADQEESLPQPSGLDFESQVNALFLEFLRPAGFSVRCFARVPYLSQGDPRAPSYALDDALLVCTACTCSRPLSGFAC